MSSPSDFHFRNKFFFGFLLGLGLTLTTVYLFNAGMAYTSSDQFCDSCHVHPHSFRTWKEGAHYQTASGVVAHCVDCHLPPPGGMDHYVEKARAGFRDLYGYYFKDITQIDWDALSTLDHAVSYTFDASCLNCHQELFPVTLSSKGVDAHLHYNKNREELRCINCHLKVGHYHEEGEEEISLPDQEITQEREWAPLVSELAPGAFEKYTEVIPGTDVKFEMVPIPGGTFWIGSPETEPFREPDEGPRRQVQVSPFWMGVFEVSWREFDAFYSQTATMGKNEAGARVADAMTGPTPPYGSPDQGWGKGMRPAITMQHYTAQRYCEWLSTVTGRHYRLPTEAEWEYACRAGTEGPYFFLSQEVSPSFLDRWYARLFGGGILDEETLGRYAWYRANSGLKTHLPETREPNPWGLYNMLGNVKEYCLDWYDPEIYASYPEDQPVVDPRGPEKGTERVIRGGSFKSDAGELRSAARDHTRHQEWLKTDPQTPKSIWWYSDVNDVGFRIVRPYESTENN